MSRYLHAAHCSKLTVKLGQYVKRGEVIARVGNTGASTGAHCHLEIWLRKPETWRKYVRGVSLASIRGLYQNPVQFYDVKRSIPIPATFPNVGYKFLQFVKETATLPYHGYWHPGDDVNGVADFGKEIRSLFNGRVVFLEDTVNGSDYNAGWGKHVFIEVDEANPGV